MELLLHSYFSVIVIVGIPVSTDSESVDIALKNLEN